MNVLPSFGSEPSYWPEVHSTLPEWRMGAISQVSGKQDTGLPWEAQGQDGDAPVLKTLFHAYLNFSLQVLATIHVHVSAYGHTCMCMCECGGQMVGIFQYHSASSVLRQGLSVDLELIDLTGIFVLVAFQLPWQNTHDKSNLSKNCLIWGSWFQMLAFMTIMVGNMPTGRRAGSLGARVVADRSHLGAHACSRENELTRKVMGF